MLNRTSCAFTAQPCFAFDPFKFYQKMTDTSSQNQDGRDILQNEVLTTAEVAIYLRVSRVTVWRWCRQGIIPASQLGRNWRIRRDDLLRILETSRSPSSASIDLSPALEDDSRTQTLPVAAPAKEEILECTADDLEASSGSNIQQV